MDPEAEPTLEEPLSDELFEKVEAPAVEAPAAETEGEMPIPAVPVPAAPMNDMPAPEIESAPPAPASFDHTGDISDEDATSGIYIAQPPPMPEGHVPGAPTGAVPTVPGMAPPPAVEAPVEETDDELELEDLEEAPIPSTFKNLQILIDNIKGEEDEPFF